MVMSGGVWNCSDSVNVGLLNIGTLTMPGGTLISRLGMIVGNGSSAGNAGTVWITGGNYFSTNGVLDIGAFAPGTVTVSNGVLATRSMVISISTNRVGTLTLAGGTSSVYSNLTIG